MKSRYSVVVCSRVYYEMYSTFFFFFVCFFVFFFFFQAEDGIRDHCVTGVQTCALPIWLTGGLAVVADGLVYPGGASSCKCLTA